MGGRIKIIKTQQLIVITLGIIAIADITAIIIIPHIIEFESVILALIMIISTIVGGFIGVLQNKNKNDNDNLDSETNTEELGGEV